MIAVVAGGTRGIGRCVAERLARAGATRLYLGYVQADDAAEECRRALPVPVVLIRENLADPRGVEAFAARVEEDVDVFVHAAALGTFKPLLDLKPNQWDLTMNVCARSFLLLLRALRPRLLPRRARVVALSSLGSTLVMPGYGAVGVAKAALEALVRYSAHELGPHGVRVNGVAAGPVESPALDLLAQRGIDAAALARATPLGRLGRADDVARVVEFLAGDLSSWICGQTLVADGGLSLGQGGG